MSTLAASRVCPRPGCPTIIPAGARYCPTHAREYEARRGTRQARGYGADHDRRRRALVARMDAGEVIRCARCGLPIGSEPWALDHTDDRAGYLGPSHERCNNSAGGKAAHR